MDYHLQMNNEQKGPYALSQIQSMWNSGAITSDSLYWDSQGEQWRPINELIASAPPVIEQSPHTTPAPSPTPSSSIPIGRFVCTSCGTVGNGISHTKGSIAIEIVCWLMLCLPGVIYSIWRLTTRKTVCHQCQSEQIVPTNTPRGQSLVHQSGSSINPAASPLPSTVIPQQEVRKKEGASPALKGCLIIFVVGLVLAVINSGESTRSTTPSSGSGSNSSGRGNSKSLALGEYTVSSDNYYGWLSREDFNKLVRFSVQEDKDAFRQFLMEGLLANRCINFKKGETVYTMEVPFLSGAVKIRRKGETKGYWTNVEAIRN